VVEARPTTQTITVDFNGTVLEVGYPPGVPRASWLDVPSPSSSSKPAEINLYINTTSLSAGTYTTKLRFTTTDLAGTEGNYTDLLISYTVVDKLSASDSQLTFASVAETTTPPAAQSFGITSSRTWTVSVDASWISLDTYSGTNLRTIKVNVDPTGLTSDSYTGHITVTDSGGQTASVTVIFNVDPHRLFVPDNGVALTSFPTAASTLTKTITVTENAGTSSAWTASSNQTWLSVTPSGTTAGDLVLTANKTGLSPDTLYFATVTVSSSDATIVNTELVQVGLWVAATDPNATDTINVTYTDVTADPIRPYVYVNNNGTDIDVYNVFTTLPVTTISNVGTKLSDMEVSSDGSTLYVADEGNGTITPIDLNTLAVGAPWLLTKSFFIHMAYSRPNGYPVLIVDDTNIYDASTGVAMGPIFDNGYYFNLVLSASLNGNKFCGIDSGLTSVSIYCYDTHYSYLNGGSLSLSDVALLKNIDINGNGWAEYGMDIALNADGSKIYTANGKPNDFIVYDGNTHGYLQSLPAALYPNNIEIGSNGLIYGGCTTTSHSTSNCTLWAYDSTGVEQYSGNITNFLHDHQLVVSGDGSRVIGLSTNTMQFITAP